MEAQYKTTNGRLLNTELKPTVKVDLVKKNGRVYLPEAFEAPVGTIIETSDGCLYRISETRLRNCTRLVRMTKRTSDGWVVKAREERHLFVKAEPQVWKRGTLNYK